MFPHKWLHTVTKQGPSKGKEGRKADNPRAVGGDRVSLDPVLEAVTTLVRPRGPFPTKAAVGPEAPAPEPWFWPNMACPPAVPAAA